MKKSDFFKAKTLIEQKLSISRIKLKLHFVHNLRLTQKLGKKGRFAKVSKGDAVVCCREPLATLKMGCLGFPDG
jgi:hypothetical protein